MTAGKMAKSAVILMPDYMSFLSTISYLAEVYLSPAKAMIQEVHNDIQDTIEDLSSKSANLLNVQMRKAK